MKGLFFNRKEENIMAGIEGDVWRVEYDRSNDPDREPGPIELNRYVINPVAPGGIPTFMRWPVCLTPEDLKAGEVDVAVIGAPLDLSTGQRGTAFGPLALRTADRYMPGGPLAPHVLTHTHVVIKPYEVLKCVDYGDAGIDPFDPALSHEEVRKRVREIAETGAIPITLGAIIPSCVQMVWRWLMFTVRAKSALFILTRITMPGLIISVTILHTVRRFVISLKMATSPVKISFKLASAATFLLKMI
jgi:hypothetical protein